MKYMRLDRSGQEELRGELQAMASFLEERFASLSADQAVTAGPAGTFSPVEQCWHLADLEREGFGARIQRLLEEDDPFLPDFDGARVAEERHYRTLSIAEGLQAFRSARAANLALLATVKDAQWSRAGRQEGVGPVALCDLPAMMAEHDRSHRAEIEAWSRGR
jgi:DinB family protein